MPFIPLEAMEEAKEDIDIDGWWRLFRRFEERRVLRAGSAQFSRKMPLLSISLLILWILTFALANVEISENAITFRFVDLSTVDDLVVTLYVGSISIGLISLVTIFASVIWGTEVTIQVQFCIMLLATILVIGVNSGETDPPTWNLAILVVNFVAASLLADVLLHLAWTRYLVPAILRWIKRRAGFPVGVCSTFLLYSVLCVPLWVPILLTYALVILLQLLGVRLIDRAIIEFVLLRRSSYDIFECSEYRRQAGGSGIVQFQVLLKEVIALRFISKPTPASIRYEGQINPAGLPHGMGRFIDNLGDGEILTGRWEAGLPVAPYQSREQRSNGATFRGTRLMWTSCSTGPLDRPVFNSRFREGDALFGTADVECCCSGTFYEGFPEISSIQKHPTMEGALEGMLEPRLHLEQREQEPVQPLQVLLFVSGFNNCVHTSLKTLAQLCSFSSFPVHILPVVFGWPCGSLPSYFNTKNIAEGACLQQAFVSFMTALRTQAGNAKIDVIAHSQGCRAMLSILSQPECKELGLRHIVLANPEADLRSFMRLGKQLRANVSSVTLYTNPKDRALWFSQFLNTVASSTPCKLEASLGRHADSLHVGEGEELDVDVIDTSSLHSNVNELRHSFFHISREMIEDFYDIIVHDLMAEKRPRLARRANQSVYDFCCAPANLTKI